MTQEITAEQAPHIHDLESYKTVTKAKRFKRTKEEMDLGLTPEKALERRLATFGNNPLQARADAASYKPWDVKEARKAYAGDTAVIVKPGDIVVRIRPGKGVSPDYFEHLPQGEILVVEDDKFYGWLDVMFGGRYNGTSAEFFTEVLDKGLGEVISHPDYKTTTEPQETPS